MHAYERNNCYNEAGIHLCQGDSRCILILGAGFAMNTQGVCRTLSNISDDFFPKRANIAQGDCGFGHIY